MAIGPLRQRRVRVRHPKRRRAEDSGGHGAARADRMAAARAVFARAHGEPAVKIRLARARRRGAAADDVQSCRRGEINLRGGWPPARPYTPAPPPESRSSRRPAGSFP